MRFGDLADRRDEFVVVGTDDRAGDAVRVTRLEVDLDPCDAGNLTAQLALEGVGELVSAREPQVRRHLRVQHQP
jgi:hypothetical protein